MNGYHHDDDEDDDQEMVRLISKSDHVVQCKNPQKSSKKRGKIKCPDMKPLEVMHSSARRRFNGKPSTFACRTGATIVCLSVAIGLWIWSGRKVNENTSILRWNSLKLREIHNWCLDVSTGKSTCQTDSDLALNLRFFLGRNPAIVSASTPWNRKVGRDTKTWQEAHAGPMFGMP